MHEIGGAPCRVARALEQGRQIVGSAPPGEVQVGDDAHEHVVEVVRDAGRELPHRLQLLRLPELLVTRPALRHVDDGSEDPGPIAVPQQGLLGHHPAHGTVGADDAILVLPLARRHSLGETGGGAIAIVGVDEREVPLATGGVRAGGQAEDRGQGGVPRELVAGGIPGPEPDAGRVDRHPQLLLALPQRQVGPLAVGDVHVDAERAHDCVAHADGGQDVVEVPRLAVNRVLHVAVDDLSAERAPVVGEPPLDDFSRQRHVLGALVAEVSPVGERRAVLAEAVPFAIPRPEVEGEALDRRRVEGAALPQLLLRPARALSELVAVLLEASDLLTERIELVVHVLRIRVPSHGVTAVLSARGATERAKRKREIPDENDQWIPRARESRRRLRRR